MSTFRYDVPPDYVGGFNRLSLPGLVKLLQRAATEDSTNLGYSPAWYRANDCAWVARSHRFDYDGSVDVQKPLLINTTIEDCRRVRSLRRYRVEQQGTEQPLATGFTDWVFVDRTNGSLKRIPEAMKNDFSPTFSEASPDRTRFNSPDRPASRFVTQYDVQFRDLDEQGHLNNTVYLDYLLDGLVRWRLEKLDVAPNELDKYKLKINAVKIRYISQVLWNQTFEQSVFETETIDSGIRFGFVVNRGEQTIAEGTGKIRESLDN